MKKITCKYGTTFSLSIIEVNTQPILEINFNIKSYKVCNNGWNTFNFPPNIIINDKLHINKETSDYIIEVLANFIKEGVLEDSTDLKYTQRGFSLLELYDIFGNVISIQESSAATESCIWFGGVVDSDKIFTWENSKMKSFSFNKGDLLIEDRLHLNIKKANKLKFAIENEWKKYNYKKNQ